MKIRNDFVTNSSSSSFIIGKHDDTTVTIDSVFQMIRTLHIEFKECQERLQQLSGCTNSIHRSVFSNSFSYDTASDGPVLLFGEQYEADKFDRSHIHHATIIVAPALYDQLNSFCDEHDTCDWYFEYSDDEIDGWWDRCETYEDYLAECKAQDILPPFVIADFSNPVLDTPLLDDTTDSGNWILHYYHSHDSDRILRRIQNKQIPEEQACLYLLGKICVYANECHHFYEYIADQLAKQSTYYSKHMG